MPRRPLSWLPRVTCDDACHKAWGSEGGTDYAIPVGTPVYAMFAGTAVFHTRGTGGWTISIRRDTDNQLGELMHLSKAKDLTLEGPPRHVKEGELVGWSGGAKGAPGAGISAGPHLHAHVYVDGIRHGMEEYLNNPKWAGGGKPIKEGERIMYRAALKGTKRVAFFDSITFHETTNGSVDDNAWGRFVGKPGLTVTQEEWDSYKEVSDSNAAKIGGAGTTSPLTLKLTGTATPA